MKHKEYREIIVNKKLFQLQSDRDVHLKALKTRLNNLWHIDNVGIKYTTSFEMLNNAKADFGFLWTSWTAVKIKLVI